ncbi:MAG: hypothetical protein R3236_08120, partial [Phycisphaeraceae bacterium]|nr:hypothetical protein [Phycisphaeraceae bacterium]
MPTHLLRNIAFAALIFAVSGFAQTSQSAKSEAGFWEKIERAYMTNDYEGFEELYKKRFKHARTLGRTKMRAVTQMNSNIRDFRPKWWKFTYSSTNVSFPVKLWGRVFKANYAPSDHLGVQPIRIRTYPKKELLVFVSWRPQLVTSDKRAIGYLAKKHGFMERDLGEVIVWHELGHNFITLNLTVDGAIKLYTQQRELFGTLQEMYADMSAIYHASPRARRVAMMFRLRELGTYDPQEIHTRAAHAIGALILHEFLKDPTKWPSLHLPPKVPEENIELNTIRYIYETIEPSWTYEEDEALRSLIKKWMGSQSKKIYFKKGEFELPSGLKMNVMSPTDNAPSDNLQKKRDAWVKNKLEGAIQSNRADKKMPKLGRIMYIPGLRSTIIVNGRRVDLDDWMRKKIEAEEAELDEPTEGDSGGGTAKAGEKLGPGRTVDLLGLMDAQKNVVRGGFLPKPGSKEWISLPNGHSIASAPLKFEPGTSYKLSVDFTQAQSGPADSEVGVVLPIGGKSAVVGLGHGKMWLGKLGKRWGAQSPVSIKADPAKGKRHTLHVTVKFKPKGHVMIDYAIDDSHPHGFRGPVSILSPEKNWKTDGHIGFGTHKTSATFHKAELTILKGSATVESPDAQPKTSSAGKTQPKDKPAPARPRTVAAGQSADVLKMVDTAGEKAKGKWSNTDAGIKAVPGSGPRANTLLPLPLKIEGDYTLEAEFTRHDGQHDVGFTIPIDQKRSATVVVGALKNTASWIGSVNGSWHQGNATKVTGAALTNGKRHKVEITFKRDGFLAKISVKLDGKTITRFSGPASSIKT